MECYALKDGTCLHSSHEVLPAEKAVAAVANTLAKALKKGALRLASAQASPRE
jgi:hypothetical protein